MRTRSAHQTHPRPVPPHRFLRRNRNNNNPRALVDATSGSRTLLPWTMTLDSIRPGVMPRFTPNGHRPLAVDWRRCTCFCFSVAHVIWRRFHSGDHLHAFRVVLSSTCVATQKRPSHQQKKHGLHAPTCNTTARFSHD